MSLDNAKMPSLKDKLRDQSPAPVTPSDESVNAPVVPESATDTADSGKEGESVPADESSAEKAKPKSKGRRLNK